MPYGGRRKVKETDGRPGTTAALRTCTRRPGLCPGRVTRRPDTGDLHAQTTRRRPGARPAHHRSAPRAAPPRGSRTRVRTSTTRGAGRPPRRGWSRRSCAAVNHAHRGSTIKVAAYSNDRKDIADALIAAHRRGVNVQMLLNDNFTSRQTKRIQRELGSRHVASPASCGSATSSCRGKRGNLHSKFYLFSQHRHDALHHDDGLGEPHRQRREDPVERHVHRERQPADVRRLLARSSSR